ncbi:MAG TPA: PVC-type heme-binding CxxCH protein [Pirellulaceae bacterium]|nr:PVC-type heme-binding CxxCH protein [Pirellulaceae bacterium]
MRTCGWLLLLVMSWFPANCLRAAEATSEPMVSDTEDPALQPITPPAALKKITVPEGFKVTLFAGEPDIRQPIAMTVDHRGRLWVAESYSYPTWAEKGQDRLVVLEDTDNDGQFDKKKVFWNQGNYLSGFAIGHGGVWVCNAPNLLFIPDANGDDVPDGEPQVMLDGWSTKGIHNVFNALNFGPDGWLYGCNGITAPSLVGKPGTDEKDRLSINCGVWRYHPTQHKFEVVAHGTTNPWGLDWNDQGQAFFTNCVTSHLWHLVPGAHYERMFGQDYNEHAYSLMPAASKFMHWAGSDWTKARGGQGEHDKLGGGHAHAGAMVYLGDNWPAKYRNSIFMCNIHGNRVNQNTLEREGSGYVAGRAPDFFFAHDDWFRGLELKCGADGGVFISDWCDTGECHDYKGVHRSSGRIYKVIYGEAQPLPAFDLSQRSDAELVELQLHKNDFYVRHARRLLQERAVAGKLASDTADKLRAQLTSQSDVTRQLRALWALHAIGAADEKFLVEQTKHDNEHMRTWAIRLLREHAGALSRQNKLLVDLAREDKSAQVRLEVASALQKLPVAERWAIATALVAHAEDATDDNLPPMIWYGMEAAIPTDKVQAAKLLAACKLPVVRQHIARRLASP